MIAPIALFVFNRVWHTEQTILALRKNLLAEQSELIIFCDGPRHKLDVPKVEQVRRYVNTIEGFKSVKVIESPTNKGLAKSIISGVSRVLKSSEAIIVLEDDMITSPYFLSYMNQGLSLYADEESVISIHGYMYPVDTDLPKNFFLRGAECWGWATWKRGWKLFEHNSFTLLLRVIFRRLIKQFDLDYSYSYSLQLISQSIGYIDSWAIRWYASAFLANKLTLYPAKSFVKNIGIDDSGTHTKSSAFFLDVTPNVENIKLEKIEIKESEQARKALIEFYRKNEKPISRRFLKKLISFLKFKA